MHIMHATEQTHLQMGMFHLQHSIKITTAQ